MDKRKSFFHSFASSVNHIPLPSKFTFPFYYEPHPLTKIAAQQVQEYLTNELKAKHNFGLGKHTEELEIGKMFGVLVSKDRTGKLGFLVAFSGKLANENHHDYFVPPVFDLLEINGFFRKEEEVINAINSELEELVNSAEYSELIDKISSTESNLKKGLEILKLQIKSNKLKRDALRNAGGLDELELEDLRVESIKEQYLLKDKKREAKEAVEDLYKKKTKLDKRIEDLKEVRRQKSASLQEKIFHEYQFLNFSGETRSLLSIFGEKGELIPPAGAGECAAPKLLHYAFQNKMKPIAMAEFWWGASPKSEVRKHQSFYPACRSKCEPILGHMLQGLEIDENPLLKQNSELSLEVLFEDESIIVVNKPANFLSVPGINLQDSVYTRIQQMRSDLSGPIIVHRLDMSTSGILMLAKNKEVHKKLQNQFTRRIVKKKYIAVLDGEPSRNNGEITLPLRVDLDDRPRQLVCYEYGKNAKTKWEIVEVKNGRAKVNFYPETGRTHQLRVHASHPQGLDCPILGDDLYGNKDERLHLHAGELSFYHPKTNEWMTISCDPDF